MDPALFDYTLPKESIAQTPADPRDSSRLLRLNRKNQSMTHAIFRDLADFLGENDVLVLNTTKVFPARLLGRKETGQPVEVLLLRPVTENRWLAIGKPRLKEGQRLFFETNLVMTVLEKHASGEITVQWETSGDSLENLFDTIGHTPIPPYIHTTLDERTLREKYQTVYAEKKGSAAAPTAGLHFTHELFERLRNKGVQVEGITLHVGLGTFQNLRPENIQQKKLHSEWYEILPETAERLNTAKAKGKRIIAVGTTTARTLESAVRSGTLQAGSNTTQLFIFPPYRFQFVDSLITNFHLPQSSLLMLVSAFASFPQTAQPFTTFSHNIIGEAYEQALQKGYRFFSFGDALWIE